MSVSVFLCDIVERERERERERETLTLPLELDAYHHGFELQSTFIKGGVAVSIIILPVWYCYE